MSLEVFNAEAKSKSHAFSVGRTLNLAVYGRLNLTFGGFLALGSHRFIVFPLVCFVGTSLVWRGSGGLVSCPGVFSLAHSTARRDF